MNDVAASGRISVRFSLRLLFLYLLTFVHLNTSLRHVGAIFTYVRHIFVLSQSFIGFVYLTVDCNIYYKFRDLYNTVVSLPLCYSKKS